MPEKLINHVVYVTDRNAGLVVQTIKADRSNHLVLVDMTTEGSVIPILRSAPPGLRSVRVARPSTLLTGPFVRPGLVLNIVAFHLESDILVFSGAGELALSDRMVDHLDARLGQDVAVQSGDVQDLLGGQLAVSCSRFWQANGFDAYALDLDGQIPALIGRLRGRCVDETNPLGFRYLASLEKRQEAGTLRLAAPRRPVGDEPPFGGRSDSWMMRLVQIDSGRQRTVTLDGILR